MNTKNYLPPTKRYRRLISAIHSIYRLVNSTYDLKDLISRLTKLISQILNSDYCLIIMLDSTKKYSVLNSDNSIAKSQFDPTFLKSFA